MLQLTNSAHIVVHAMVLSSVMSKLAKDPCEALNIHAASILSLINIIAERTNTPHEELLIEVEQWLEETLGYLKKNVLPRFEKAKD